jgi:pimeloyl-ACP methyl ester carboxylesterase
MTYRLAFALACSLWPVMASDADTSPPDPAQTATLHQLVHQYLTAENSEQSSHLLTTILQDKDATLATIEQLIRTGSSYDTEPVGLLPDERVTVRERAYQVSLAVPSSYHPSKSYGLVVCLHGAGFTGAAYLERWQPRLGGEYLLACPTYPQGAWFTRRAEDLVLATIRLVQRRYHIDPDRIFLTGMSNGGIGAWLIGMHHAPRFAGIAPMASGLDSVLFPFLENLRTTPAYIIHGAHDQVMPVELSRSIANELTQLGYPFVYREHDRMHPTAGGHFFPREELPDLVTWFSQQRRVPLPNILTVVQDASHLLPFGWVRIDTTDRIATFSDDLVDRHDELIRKRVYARLHAEITTPNRIDVRTEHVQGFSLFLNNRLVDMSQPITVLTNGQVSFEGLVIPSVGTMLRQARLRQDIQLLFPAHLRIAVAPKP